MSRKPGRPGARGSRIRRRQRIEKNGGHTPLELTEDQIAAALGLPKEALFPKPCPQCGHPRDYLLEREQFDICMARGGVPRGYHLASHPNPDEPDVLDYWVQPIGSSDRYNVALCQGCASYELVRSVMDP